MTAPPTAPPGAAVRPAAVFELTPSIGLTEEYTDNFFLTNQNKRSNFRTTLDAGLTLGISGVRTRGAINLGYGITYDTLNDELDGGLNSALNGQLTYEVTPLVTLTLTDSLTVSDDPFLADNLNLRRERSPYVANTFSVAADYRLPTLDASVTGYYTLATFFPEDGSNTIGHTVGIQGRKTFLVTNFASLGYEFQYSDEVTGHLVNASVGRQLNVFTSVGLSTSYGIRDVSDEEDYDLLTVALFGAYNPGPWSVSLSLGYSFIFPEESEDRSQPYVSGTLGFPLGRGSVTITASAGFAETFSAAVEDSGTVETWGITGTFAYPLTPLIGAQASIGYRENKDTGLGGGTTEINSESVWFGSVGVSIPLRRWLTLSADYRYTNSDATPETESYTENRATVSLRATF